MTLINHLQNQDRSQLLLEDAFGPRVVKGDLIMSDVEGTQQNYRLNVMIALGEGTPHGWHRCRGVWFDSLSIPAPDFRFHSGTKASLSDEPGQTVDDYFNYDIPHSNTVWLGVKTGQNTGSFDNKQNPPSDIFGIYDCLTGEIYDANGNSIATEYIKNPMEAIAFLMKHRGKLDISQLIDWTSWHQVKIQNQRLLDCDYRALSETGCGWTAKYYNGTNFQNFALRRIERVINLKVTDTSPDNVVDFGAFSARFESYLRPNESGNYTFTLTHDNGARFWIVPEGTSFGVALIDEWQDDGQHPIGVNTVSTQLDANTWYEVRLDWNEGGVIGEVKLEWECAALDIAKEIVPMDVVYPKNEMQPAYEVGVGFAKSTLLPDAINTILANSNGIMQLANGKYKFSSYDTLTPTFEFNEDNILPGTFSFRSKDRRDLRNKFQGLFRDIELQFLEYADPALVIERRQLQKLHNQIVDGESIDLQYMSRSQAHRVLERIVWEETDSDIICEFDGNCITYPVLQGDLVTVTYDTANFVSKEFIVDKVIDHSSEETADERSFVLLEWVRPINKGK